MSRRFLTSALLSAALLASVLAGCARNGTTVSVTFDDAGDLQPRGSVQVADVRIGRIGSIHLTKDFKARVTLHLNAGRDVPRDSTAVLRTTSLLGEKFVELRPSGNPGKGPFLRDGDVLTKVQQAPELEFVAEQAVSVLGAVTAGDVATLVDTGATAFRGREGDLRTLIGSLDTYSAALASRTDNIAKIVDNLDAATATLANGVESIKGVLGDLAATTKVLADNREQAVTALNNLARIAATQNQVFDKYENDIGKQIHQVDDIVRIVAGQTTELSNLIDWLDRFVTVLPEIIPNDFTQVFAWIVPAALDPRAGK
ncbi:MAG: phospholipid/cholesterol/gamma-HCH transport system substrate-binding protein [Actinomycetota bacterium]